MKSILVEVLKDIFNEDRQADLNYLKYALSKLTPPRLKAIFQYIRKQIPPNISRQQAVQLLLDEANNNDRIAAGIKYAVGRLNAIGKNLPK